MKAASTNPQKTAWRRRPTLHGWTKSSSPAPVPMSAWSSTHPSAGDELRRQVGRRQSALSRGRACAPAARPRCAWPPRSPWSPTCWPAGGSGRRSRYSTTGSPRSRPNGRWAGWRPQVVVSAEPRRRRSCAASHAPARHRPRPPRQPRPHPARPGAAQLGLDRPLEGHRADRGRPDRRDRPLRADGRRPPAAASASCRWRPWSTCSAWSAACCTACTPGSTRLPRSG